MRILLVVDVQKEFASTDKGKEMYKKLCKFINERGHEDYDQVVATLYKNGNSNNMKTLVGWTEMMDIEDVDFQADYSLFHSGYCPKYMSFVSKDDTVDVIGFDTDACVLSTLYHLFDADIPFTVFSNGIYSSGGDEMQEAGLKIIKRQFGNALKECEYL